MNTATINQTLPDEGTLDGLRANKWVCDYETHRTLWQAQSICLMLSDRMQNTNGNEVELLAIEGVEQLLCSVIRRTGWSPVGHDDGGGA